MLKGYIEAYYGRLFSQDERAKVINHMGKLNMDFYLYVLKKIYTIELGGQRHTLLKNKKF